MEANEKEVIGILTNQAAVLLQENAYLNSIVSQQRKEIEKLRNEVVEEMDAE